MNVLSLRRVGLVAAFIKNCSSKHVGVSYCTRPKKFHEEVFDKVREARRKAEDKSFEPSKLFMVKRLKDVKGLPYWEKLLLRRIGLENYYPDTVILKNTPSINRLLWEIKHAVRIVPITFPNGLPKEGDYTGTYLKRNGEFIISPKLKVDPRLLLVDPEKEKKKLDGKTILSECRRNWAV
ncbi:large ribosomal subunit protein uL30m [Centruroides vittatus]|uniref:large ribosomal subunit protein uL30m n=1 Tax=Centruroides vittatus TaxID=120091 RepID=UPI00350EA0F5